MNKIWMTRTWGEGCAGMPASFFGGPNRLQKNTSSGSSSTQNQIVLLWLTSFFTLQAPPADGSSVSVDVNPQR